MILDEKKIAYVSGHDADKDPGVTQKISGLCRSARKQGFTTVVFNRYCRDIDSRRQLMDQALATNAKYIIIRSFGYCNLFIMSRVAKARCQGRIIICDQPTPMKACLYEVMAQHRAWYKKLMELLMICLHGSIGFMPFNRIVHYADESSFFNWAVRNKSVKMGNGIDPDAVNLREPRLPDKDTLEILGVANVSFSHGFDRVIRAVAEYNHISGHRARFHIVGGEEDNPEIISLKALAESLGIEDCVIFHGRKGSNYISGLYSRCDLGIGALGLHRKGLKDSSILKIREYALAGIPFITAGSDPDFNGEESFRFEVPNDESISPIVDCLISFPEKRKRFTDSQIREFAKANLAYSNKLPAILDGL